MIDINMNLVDIYYNSIIEYRWSPQTIKNKLAYYKRKSMFVEHLALHVAKDKYNINLLASKVSLP